MRISTKGRYATRLMLDLAVHYECGYIPLKAVSQRQNISDKYLEQIITQLSRAGLVRSARGAQGGYQLTKPPEEYTVGDILRTTEQSGAGILSGNRKRRLRNGADLCDPGGLAAN